MMSQSKGLPSRPASVFSHFRATGTCHKAIPFGSGHIHSTWLLHTLEEEAPDYILQKINHNVFPNIPLMMDNIVKVIQHLRNRPSGKGQSKVPSLIKTNNGSAFLKDADDNHWRLYEKISPGISYDVIPNEEVAFEAGRAFGAFIYDLRGLPADELTPVIPGFHSLHLRTNQLKQALKTASRERLSEVKKELDFAETQIKRLKFLSPNGNEDKLPRRITHNDTKLNNLLFDEHQRAVCVIDLDTVMPGRSLYDFGDLVRTAANTRAEDEIKTDQIDFSISTFRAIASGFLQSTSSLLTTEEKALLPVSAQYMAAIMGIRFLTDYLSGDRYYSIDYPGHNKVRCRAQFRLLQRMIDQEEVAEKALKSIRG